MACRNISVLKFDKHQEPHASKRLRTRSSETDNSDYTCQNCDYIVQESLICTGCKLVFCLACAKISKELYKCIENGDMDDFHWTCRACKATFPSLENISSAIQDIRQNHEKRLTDVEVKLERIEGNIGENIGSVKQGIIKELKAEMNSLVDSRSNELEDRKRRELNVIFFNLPESANDNGAERKTDDESLVLDISDSLSQENLEICTSFRLGKKQDKTRPLKVILKEKKQRRFLLDNAKHIHIKAKQSLQRVVLAKDLTPSQREERKVRLKREETKHPHLSPKCSGQQPESIQKIVTVPGYKKQERNNPVAMETTLQLPSPIKSQSTQSQPLFSLSSLNRFEDQKRETTTNIFDDSTILEDGELTIPGGIASNITVTSQNNDSGTAG